VTLSNPESWIGNGSSFNVTFTSGVDNYEVRISKGTDLATAPPPTGAVNVIGVGGQYDTSSPFFDGYQLMPRMSQDIMLLTDTQDISKTDKHSQLLPNPNNGDFIIEANEGMRQIEVYDASQRLVQAGQYQNAERIPITLHSSGLYIVKVIYESGVFEVHRTIVDK